MWKKDDASAIRMSEHSCESFSRSARINVFPKFCDSRTCTYETHVNGYSVIRLKEYMRTAWLSWARGFFDVLFVIVVFVVLVECLGSGIWRLLRVRLFGIRICFPCSDFRSCQCSDSCLEITKPYFKFADFRFRTYSLMFSTLVARVVEFPRVSFLLRCLL